MQQQTYKGKDLDEIMVQIASTYGDRARIVAVDTARTGGLLGFFQREEHVLVAEIDETNRDEDRDRASHNDVENPEGFVRYSDDDFQFANIAFDQEIARDKEVPQHSDARSVVDVLIDQAESTQDVFEIAGAASSPRTFAEALENVTGSLGAPVTEIPEQLVDPSLDWARLAMQSYDDHSLSAVDTAGHDGIHAELSWRLRSAGYPAKLLAQLASNGTDGISIVRALSITPQPRHLPRTPGSLIAIVGPAERAVDIAIRVATELQAANTTIAFVTNAVRVMNPPLGTRNLSSALPVDWDETTDPTMQWQPRGNAESMFEAGFIARSLDEIGDLVNGWRRDRIGIVAVACDMQVHTYSWVRSALQALSPTYVSLLARATTKAEDVNMTSNLIGGADSLMVDGLNESMTPLSILGSEIPVSHLNGRIANAQEWQRIFDAIPTLDPEV